jgi:hypothetical protein
MSNTNLVLKKLALKQVTSKKPSKVALSKIDDNINEYNNTIELFRENTQSIYNHLESLLDLAQYGLQLNKTLSDIYLSTDALYVQAVEIGVDDLLPEEIINIFDLDVSAGLNGIERKLESIKTMALNTLEDTLVHNDI